ncbi:MAG TPA: hypothetical protein DDW27_16175 [Bacteroidales bacterium]|nr:hypothetical protein [Bacteroidales bacterium]
MDNYNSYELRYRAEALADYYSVPKYVNVNIYDKQSDRYLYFSNDSCAIFFISYALDPNYHSLNDVAAN